MTIADRFSRIVSACGGAEGAAATLFAAIMLGLMWSIQLHRIDSERADAIEDLARQSANFAIAYEENVGSIFEDIDQTLRAMVRQYRKYGRRADIHTLLEDREDEDKKFNFAGVADERGNVVAASAKIEFASAAEQEYFQVHRQQDTTRIFIGKPELNRASGEWSFDVSRRISNPDGSFGGVAFARIDPHLFLRFYQRIDLGSNGVITLISLDGTSIARQTGSLGSFGQDMRQSTVLAKARSAPSGTFTSVGRLDGVSRLYSFRKLQLYPLIVAVALAPDDVVSAGKVRERNYYLAAAFISAMAILFTTGLIAALARRNRALASLYQSEARFGIAFNQTAVGIAMTGMDRRFLDANDKFCDMLGYTREELLGLTFIDVTHPDDWELADDHAARALASGNTREIPAIDKRYVRKDGSTVWVMISVATVRDERGNPERYMAVIQDITDRKRAELVLADSEKRFRALIENSSDLVVVVGRDGAIRYVSPSVKPIAGYEVEETLGRMFIDFMHPDESAIARELFPALVRNAGGVQTVERRFRHKDGFWISLQISARSALDDPTVQGFVVNARDITERKHAEQVLHKVNRARKALSSCNGVLVRAAEEKQLMQGFCDNIVEIGGYFLAWVGFVEHDAQKSVRPVAYAGYATGYMEQARASWSDTESGHGPIGMAIRTRTSQVIQNARDDPSFHLWQGNAARIGYGSVLALPLLASGEVIGVLTIYSSEIDAFDPEEIELLGELAGDLSYGIVTLRTRHAHELSTARLMRSMEGTILAMAATLEMRDAYTAGHQRRVADLTVAIAREMGLPQDDIHGMYLAAVIHDIGKIQVPAEILSKPTRLTALEYEMIKTHPQAGYDILKEVEFEWPIAELVYQHHERLDGTGYPRGLAGDDIILGARIIAVADTVEAMASHRPYRPGMGTDKALAEIERGRGAGYDPRVVDACLSLFREKGYSLEN